MEDTRKGFFLPEQEKVIDKLVKLKGAAEVLDGKVIQIADNQGLERAKKAIVEKWGEGVLPDIYNIVDSFMEALETLLPDEGGEEEKQ